MNLLDLPEKEFDKVKNQLLENGTILKKKKINSYDAKFFETVTISNTLIKFFLFFSLGLYAVINLIGLILSIIYDTFNLVNPLQVGVGVFFICFIVAAIFSNINTNKKKEESVIYVKDDNFIFNFTDGVVNTPELFYSLPYHSVKKIEFLIHSLRKKETFGSVTFTFSVLGYEETHSIRFTNLTKIEQFLRSKFPELLSKLIVDGKSKKDVEPTKNNKKVKCLLISFGCLIVATSLIVIPNILNYYSVALIASSVIVFITAIIVFLSCYLYTYHLIQGIIISSVFIIMGFCVPLLIIENSGVSFMSYIILNNQILMLTIFGIIGLCLYTYIITITIGKILYIIRRKNSKNISY